MQFIKGYFQWNGEDLECQKHSRIAPRTVDALNQVTEAQRWENNKKCIFVFNKE